MFEDLFTWWKEDILLKGALEGIADMLKTISEMFDLSTGSFLKGIKRDEDIYEMDRSVNVQEIEIRKKIYEHLSIHPKQDITSSLILSTIVIDIERIGDYLKNIYELSLIHTVDDQIRYYEEAKRITQHIRNMLLKVNDALKDGDIEAAKKLMDEKNWICKKCDGLINEIIIDELIRVRPAVVYSLLFRYIKRVTAHIGNVASSIVNPFHQIGFKPE
ncbi:phosphate uptake regulator PhoU [candidate division WOR-3 bacterium]|nr:phosphate uptake regulator PhoU [candidate division WOR-3 bacterium]